MAMRTGRGARFNGPESVPCLPWHIVLPIGGGPALATRFTHTGLAEIVGSWFETAGSLPVFAPTLPMRCARRNLA